MGRYTAAYSSLCVGFKEINALINIAAHKENIDPIGLRHEIKAICRGAVVLLSAHIEAYIKDLGEIALDEIYQKAVPRVKLNDALFYHISKDYFLEITESREPKKIANKVFSFIAADVSFWSKEGPFTEPIPVERFNKGFSNPAFDKACAYFNRFGYEKYKYDMGCHLKANYQLTINMIDHLVDIRNQISHGESQATKTPSELQVMVSIIRDYCTATDSVFGSWCKNNLCPIR